MCGFFQVVQKNKPLNKQKFMESLDSMRHRGPDYKGDYFTEAQEGSDTIYMGFGHQRLSILDLEERSNQPFLLNNDVLLFNGEIYNFKELKQEHNKFSYHTDGDTELVANMLAADPTKNSLNSFNGMWALSFYEANQDAIFLSRDRYGKKPLFYYLDNDTFCVSSTIKAIKIYLGLDLEFEEDHLLNYLIHGDMFPSDTISTHFKNINQILPGHNGRFDLRTWSIEQEQYFDVFEKKDDDFSEDNLVKKLQRSVDLRLNSDRPIALLLSGGIDSSLILSILHSMGHHEKVHVFMGDTGRSDDYKYAKQCVEQLGVKAETIVSDYSSNTFDRFLDICNHHEKAFPFNGNAIAMSQMYEEIADHGIPVVLDGSGGDEIFGGYWQRHIPFALKEAKRDGEQAWIDSIFKYNSKKNEVKNFEDFISRDDPMQKRFNPFYKIGAKRLKEIQMMDPIKENSLSFEEALCLDAAPGGRLGEWIWHNDRNSMMYSVESRSPFLDYELHSFIHSGYQNKFHENWNKYELRKVFDRFTPLPTQWRVDKQGFRWDGKHFFYNNKDEIIELIRGSEILREYVRTDLFCFVADNFPKIFKSSIGRRFLSIAGIEYMMKKD